MIDRSEATLPPTAYQITDVNICSNEDLRYQQDTMAIYGDLIIEGIPDERVSLPKLVAIHGNIAVINCPNLVAIDAPRWELWVNAPERKRLTVLSSPHFKLDSIRETLQQNQGVMETLTPPPMPDQAILQRCAVRDNLQQQHSAVDENEKLTFFIMKLDQNGKILVADAITHEHAGPDIGWSNTISWVLPRVKHIRLTVVHMLQRTYYHWYDIETHDIFVSYIVASNPQKPIMDGIALATPTSYGPQWTVRDSIAANFLGPTSFQRVDLIVNAEGKYTVATSMRQLTHLGQYDIDEPRLQVMYYSDHPRDADKAHLLIITKKNIHVMGGQTSPLGLSLYTIQILQAPGQTVIQAVTSARRPNRRDLLVMLVTLPPEDGKDETDVTVLSVDYRNMYETVGEPQLEWTQRLCDHCAALIQNPIAMEVLMRDGEIFGAVIVGHRHDVLHLNPKTQHVATFSTQVDIGEKRYSFHMELLPKGEGIKIHRIIDRTATDLICLKTLDGGHALTLAFSKSWQMKAPNLYAVPHPFPKYVMRKETYNVAKIRSFSAYIEPPPTQWNPFEIPMNQMAHLAVASVRNTQRSSTMLSTTDHDYFTISGKFQTSMHMPGLSVDHHIEAELREAVERTQKKEVTRTLTIGFSTSNLPVVHAKTGVYHQTTYTLYDQYGEKHGSFDYLEPALDAPDDGDLVTEAVDAGVKLDYMPGNLMSHSGRLPPPGAEDMLGLQHRRKCMLGSEYEWDLSMEDFIQQGKTTSSARKLKVGAGLEMGGSIFGYGASAGFSINAEGGMESTVITQSSAMSSLTIHIEAGKIERGAFDYTLVPSLFMHDGVLTLTWAIEVAKYGAWGGIYGLLPDPIFRTPFIRPSIFQGESFPLQFYSHDIVAVEQKQKDHYDVVVTLQNASFKGAEELTILLMIREVSPFLFHFPPNHPKVKDTPQSLVRSITYNEVEPMEMITVTFRDIYIPLPVSDRFAQIIAMVEPQEDGGDNDGYAFPKINKWAYTSLPSLLDSPCITSFTFSQCIVCDADHNPKKKKSRDFLLSPPPRPQNRFFPIFNFLPPFLF